MKVTHSHIRRISVVAAFRNAIRHEMLERRYHTLIPSVMLRTCSTYHCSRHLGCEICILTICLLDSRPSRLTRKIDYRAISDVASLCTKFAGDCLSHLCDQGLVPCRGKSDTCREYSCTDGHMTMRSLLCKYHRDTKSGAVNRISLQSIVCFSRKSRIQTVLKGLSCPRVGSECCPEHTAVLLIDEFPVFIGNSHRLPCLFIHRPSERAEKLS